MEKLYRFARCFACLACTAVAARADNSAAALGITFVPGSSSQVIVERGGQKYVVDLASQSIRSYVADPQKDSGGKAQDGARVFQQNCTGCHGSGGKGNPAMGTPDFTDPKVQSSVTDDQILQTIRQGRKGTRMPAWQGKLSDADMQAVAKYIRSLGGQGGGDGQSQSASSGTPGAAAAEQPRPGVYERGDDLLVSLPTGRRLDRHGVYVNFTHRFAFDPAFSGAARGGDLIGLDGFALASFGVGYGVTKNFWVDVYRSPTFIGRPIQLMAGYSLADERDGRPFNATIRASIEGRNDFSRQFTENLELIVSRSITRYAQFYAAPTFSFNDRRLVQPANERSRSIPSVPGFDAVSIGFGLAVDMRPTVALLAEVIPTVDDGPELGIHRPAYSFGIQKKLRKHAFTLGFTNSPGTTVSQRAGTLAAYLGRPGADKPRGLVIGFDLTRQIH